MWDELVRRSDIRHALRMVVFMETWYTTVREWDGEPTPEQFGEAWDLKRGRSRIRSAIPPFASERVLTDSYLPAGRSGGRPGFTLGLRQVPWEHVPSR